MQTTDVSSGKAGAVPMPLTEPDPVIPEGAGETATPLAKPPAEVGRDAG